MFEDREVPSQGELFHGSLFGESIPASIPARPAKRGQSKAAKKLPNFDQRQWQAVQAMADLLDSKDTLRPGEIGVEKEADPLAGGEGRPSLRLESVAGAGKSAVAMGAIEEAARKTGILLATFGKKIQLETEKRVKDYHPDSVVNGVSVISVRTINSLGDSLLHRNLSFGGGGYSQQNGAVVKPEYKAGDRRPKGRLYLDSGTSKRPEGRVNKYRDIAEEVAELPSLAEVLGKDDHNRVRVAPLLSLFNGCRVRMMRDPSPAQLKVLAKELGLEFLNPSAEGEGPWERLALAVQEITLKGLQLELFEYTGKDGVIDVYEGLIDGTDQLWLPFLMNAQPPANWKFRAAVVDEYQDLSPLQLWVVEQFLHADSPIVFVGDRRQCIFGFLGAGQSTFQYIEERYPGAALSLTDSYRCPEAHLALARHFHSKIRRAAALPPDPPGSSPSLLEAAEMYDLLRPGDVVLGRSNAALVQAGLHYLLQQKLDPKTGKLMGCRITVPGLSGLLNNAIDEVSQQWRKKTGASRLNFQRDFREALTHALNNCPAGDEDKFRLLDVLYEFAHDRQQGRTQREFCNFAATLVESPAIGSDKNTRGRAVVNFKTIHSFKGMEAPRVFVVSLGLTGDFFKSKMSHERWIEEMNLSYVALTRSTHELYLVPDFHAASMRDIGELMRKPVPRPAD